MLEDNINQNIARPELLQIAESVAREKSIVGKLIRHSNGLVFEIIDSDMRRIKKIKITGHPKV